MYLQTLTTRQNLTIRGFSKKNASVLNQTHYSFYAVIINIYSAIKNPNIPFSAISNIIFINVLILFLTKLNILFYS